MLHLTKCSCAAQFWGWIFVVCTDVLRMPAPDDPSKAIIFNIWNSRSPKPKLAPMPACALIRHAFNCYYYELVTVATNPDKKFHCEHVFAKTMHSFRNAVLAYCKGLEIQQLSLRYSGKPQPPLSSSPTVKQLAPLAKIEPLTGHGKITPAFQAAIDKADALSAGVHDNQQRSGLHAMARDA